MAHHLGRPSMKALLQYAFRLTPKNRLAPSMMSHALCTRRVTRKRRKGKKSQPDLLRSNMSYSMTDSSRTANLITKFVRD